MSRVDVIVPCYNYARYLPTCLNSVLNQSHSDVHVLVIDDASTDATSAVAAEYAARDKRVEVRRHSSNCGNIATYNEGLEWASGDYLLLLSADDWLTPGALARAAYVLDSRPEVGLTCGGAVVVEQGKQLSEVPIQGDCCDYQVISGQSFIEKTCLNSTASPLWTPTAIVRTAIQKQVGGYNKALPHAGDLEMWLRFACRSSVATLDAYQAYYRKHESNMHYTESRRLLGNSRQHLSAFESVFNEYGTEIADREKLEQVYRNALAGDALNAAAGAFDEGRYADCAEYMLFAESVYPEIRGTSAWYRMRAKKMLGPELVGQLRSVSNFLREKAGSVLRPQ